MAENVAIYAQLFAEYKKLQRLFRTRGKQCDEKSCGLCAGSSEKKAARQERGAIAPLFVEKHL